MHYGFIGLGNLGGHLAASLLSAGFTVSVNDKKRQLGDRLVEGSAGGGAVRCVLTGHLDVQSIRIDPSAVDPANVRGLEELVTAAVRQALQAALELKKTETERVTGGILPDLGF